MNKFRNLIPGIRDKDKNIRRMAYIGYTLLIIFVVIILVPSKYNSKIVSKLEGSSSYVVKRPVIKKPIANYPKQPKMINLKQERELISRSTHMLQKKLGDMSDVTYDKQSSTFLIKPKSDELIIKIISLIDGNTKYREQWDESVLELRSLSSQVNKLVPNSSVALVNPFNEQNKLLLINKGTVLYDFTKSNS